MKSAELFRLALIYGAQDRHAYAQADKGPEGDKAAALAKEMDRYRLHRWGQTSMERMLKESRVVLLSDILKRPMDGKP